MSLALRAKQFATQAHASIDQRRKYTGEPYINHPAEVVDILTKFSERPVSEVMIAAAWLHDTVEDTAVSLGLIEEQFGKKVADLVEQLTDVSQPHHGNRTVRKAMDRAHTACASPEAKSIKLADLISNTASIVSQDPEFAKVYMVEKRALLEVLGGGDPHLMRIARHIVDSYFQNQNPQMELLAA